MQDKKTLFTIIILLIIILPLSIIGAVKHFSKGADDNKGLVDDNPNKEIVYKNKVYLYQDDKLIDIYECSGTCAKPVSSLDDKSYHTNSYIYGEPNINPVIDNTWAIFKEDNYLKLYNHVGHKVAVSYNDIKTYGVSKTKNVLIAKSMDGFWGTAYLDLSSQGIPFQYNYLALPAHFIMDNLDTSTYIAKKGETWYILNADGSEIKATSNSEIVDFNDNYYITYDNTYHIYDYNNNEYLNNLDKEHVYAIGSYVFIYLRGNLLVYKDCNIGAIKNLTIPEFNNLYLKIDGNKVSVMIDNKLFETLELS